MGNDKQLYRAMIYKCSACGHMHEDMVFKEFPSPIQVNGKEYTYYGVCPVKKETVYMRKVKLTELTSLTE
jgi:hypothetical protein